MCVCVGSELPVPQSVSIQKDLRSRTLTLSWQSEASHFDVEIYYTELMELVFNVRFSAANSRPLQLVQLESRIPPCDCRLIMVSDRSVTCICTGV